MVIPPTGAHAVSTKQSIELDPTTSTKASILKALAQIQTSVHDHFAAMPAETFVRSAPDTWSPSEELEHLIKAAQPVCKALGQPKSSLRELFGLAQEPSLSFEALRARYIQGLANGVQATGRYLPTQPPTTDVDTHQQALLQDWDDVATALIAAVARWEDADLDRYLLPHPALGKLTIREILFFTIFHSAHHVNGGRD